MDGRSSLKAWTKEIRPPTSTRASLLRRTPSPPRGKRWVPRLTWAEKDFRMASHLDRRFPGLDDRPVTIIDAGNDRVVTVVHQAGRGKGSGAAVEVQFGTSTRSRPARSSSSGTTSTPPRPSQPWACRVSGPFRSPVASEVAWGDGAPSVAPRSWTGLRRAVFWRRTPAIAGFEKPGVGLLTRQLLRNPVS